MGIKDDFDDIEEDEDDDEEDIEQIKIKRKKRFTNKNKKDKTKHYREPTREKVKNKIHRPKYHYDPDYYDEDDEDMYEF